LISSSSGNLVHTFPAHGRPEFGSSLAALPARDGKPGYLAVKAERHVHVLDLAEKRPLYVVPSRMVSIIDDFGASMSLVFDPKHGALPVLVAGANESCPPGFFDSGYADLCGADGKVIRALMPEDRSQGIDATAIADFDGDQRPDYACVLVNDMRLVLIGSDEKTARREIELLEPAPSSK
jgi:hypothetical protein